MTRPHTDRGYEEELNRLRERLLRMGGRVEQMIADAVSAAVRHDVELAARTDAADPAVDEDELGVDELCLSIMARRQPVGVDLRLVAFAFKVVTDLERMGDLATSIARRTLEGEARSDLRPMPEVSELGASVQEMVHLALDAFVTGDAAPAHEVLRRDDAVDQLYARLFRVMLDEMARSGTSADHCVRIQSVAKHLERIGDHATNIAEHVVFLVDGQDVRHRGRNSGA